MSKANNKTASKPVNNIQELRYKLAELYAKLEDGAIEPSLAKQMNMAAANIIKTVQVDLIKSQSIGLVSDIDFILTEKELEERNKNKLADSSDTVGELLTMRKAQ